MNYKYDEFLRNGCVELQNENARLREALERIAKNHRYCEDGWYSCPADPEYFGPDESGECNCWAGVARAALEVKP